MEGHAVRQCLSTRAVIDLCTERAPACIQGSCVVVAVVVVAVGGSSQVYQNPDTSFRTPPPLTTLPLSQFESRCFVCLKLVPVRRWL